MDLQKIIKEAEKAVSKPLSKRTLTDYRRAFNRLDGQTPQAYREHSISVLKKSVSSNEYRKLKGGYQRECAERVVGHTRSSKELRAQGRHTEAAEHDALAAKWATAYAEQKPDYDHQRYRQKLGPAHPKPPTVKKKSKSKKQSLAPINREFPDREWQDIILAEMPEQHKDVTALLICAGPRPVEVDQNTDEYPELKPAELSITDDNKLSIKIWGAKITKSSGQPWRELTFDPEKDRFAECLYTLTLFHGGSTTIKMSCSQRAFRDSHARAVKRGLGAKWGGKISPYSHRQAFSADLKKAGHNSEEVTLAMGHASDRSQSYYGMARQGNAGGRGLESVEAARAVKLSGQGQDIRQRIAAAKAAKAMAADAETMEAFEALDSIDFEEDEQDQNSPK